MSENVMTKADTYKSVFELYREYVGGSNVKKDVVDNFVKLLTKLANEDTLELRYNLYGLACGVVKEQSEKKDWKTILFEGGFFTDKEAYNTVIHGVQRMLRNDETVPSAKVNILRKLYSYEADGFKKGGLYYLTILLNEFIALYDCAVLGSKYSMRELDWSIRNLCNQECEIRNMLREYEVVELNNISDDGVREKEFTFIREFLYPKLDTCISGISSLASGASNAEIVYPTVYNIVMED